MKTALSTAACLWKETAAFAVDLVGGFQELEWWRNGKGETKRS